MYLGLSIAEQKRKIGKSYIAFAVDILKNLAQKR